MTTCACGCGQPVPIAKHTRKALGHVKGQPVKFVRGHNNRLVAGQRPGRDPVQAGRREAQARYERGTCETPGCGKPAIDRHHVDGNTSNNAPENIRRLCRRCHMREDGRGTGGLDHQRAHGEAHGAAKLTEADVRAIRRRRPAELLSALATEYGVTETTISDIARRRTWRHVG
jgi:5-methylcytosine-specific restriction endonuclease McrA